MHISLKPSIHKFVHIYGCHDLLDRSYGILHLLLNTGSEEVTFRYLLYSGT